MSVILASEMRVWGCPILKLWEHIEHCINREELEKSAESVSPAGGASFLPERVCYMLGGLSIVLRWSG